MQQFGKDIQEAARRISRILSAEEVRRRNGRNSRSQGPTNQSGSAQEVVPSDVGIRRADRLGTGGFELSPIELSYGTYEVTVTVVNTDVSTDNRQQSPTVDLKANLQLPTGADPYIHFLGPLSYGESVTKTMTADIRAPRAVARVFVFNASGFEVTVGFQFKKQHNI